MGGRGWSENGEWRVVAMVVGGGGLSSGFRVVGVILVMRVEYCGKQKGEGGLWRGEDGVDR